MDHQHEAAPQTGVALQLLGLSSFILSNNGGVFGLSINTNDKGIQTKTAANFYYLSYGVFKLTGGHCGQCIGYDIFYNGECVATCPPSSYFDGTTCVTCASGISLGWIEMRH